MPQNQLNYEDYFQYEHFFYKDEITKSKSFMNFRASTSAYSLQKRNSDLFYNNNKVDDSVGNSELMFFSINHSVYRYHVKSQKIDFMFYAPDMEEFYPITSHKILWKKATAKSSAVTFCIEEIHNGTYYLFDANEGKSEIAKNPEMLLARTAVDGGLLLPAYSTTIGSTSIPINESGFRYGDRYIDDPSVSAQFCQNFAIVVFSRIHNRAPSTYYNRWYYRVYPSTTSEDEMYNIITYYPRGSLLRLNFKDKKLGNQHTVIVAGWYSTAYILYDSNIFGDQKVYIRQLTKKQMFETYSIDHIAYYR